MTENEAIKWFKGFYNGDCEREDFEDTICADCNFPCRHGMPILRAISALEEIQQYREIGTVEELKAIKQWKSDIIESFIKYDVNSVDELMKRFRELTENNNRIIEILRTHRFTDEECVKEIVKIIGICSYD